LCKYHAIPWVISRSSNNHLMFNRRCQGSDCLAAGGWDLSTLEPFSFGALVSTGCCIGFGRGRPSNFGAEISVLRQGRKHRQCDPIWLGEGDIHWTGFHTVSYIQSLIRPLQFQLRVLYHLQYICIYIYISKGVRVPTTQTTTTTDNGSSLWGPQFCIKARTYPSPVGFPCSVNV
jgi:hypothetical protein